MVVVYNLDIYYTNC